MNEFNNEFDMEGLVLRASAFAKERHAGQFRRDGVTPYFEHCEKVASLVDTPFRKVVAYLHDLVEDNRATYEEVLQLVEDPFFGNKVVDCLQLLTHVRGVVTYEEYINNFHYVNRDEVYYVALSVKVADIVANLSDSPTLSQIKKYNKALHILTMC